MASHNYCKIYYSLRKHKAKINWILLQLTHQSHYVSKTQAILYLEQFLPSFDLLELFTGAIEHFSFPCLAQLCPDFWNVIFF